MTDVSLEYPRPWNSLLGGTEGDALVYDPVNQWANQLFVSGGCSFQNSNNQRDDGAGQPLVTFVSVLHAVVAQTSFVRIWHCMDLFSV